MGFAGKSGASATALGALRQYGLVDAVDGGVRVNPLGLTVLEPSDDEEYREAIHVASRHPTVFSQIQEHFEGDPPKSDEPLKSFLIRSLNFSRKGADECVSSFRETFSYAEEFSIRDGSPPILASGREETSGSARGSASPSFHTQNNADAFSEVVVVPLTRECKVEMRFVGELSDKALTKLARYVELMKEDWV
jgi:hypothetical protein